MFFVLEFPDQSVEAVPDNWLTEKGGKCLWPPFRGKTFKQAVENRMVPENKWRCFNVKRIMGKYATYAVASSKASKASYESDLATTEADSGDDQPAKRTRIRSQPFSPVSEKKLRTKSTGNQIAFQTTPTSTFLDLIHDTPMGLSEMHPPSAVAPMTSMFDNVASPTFLGNSMMAVSNAGAMAVSTPVSPVVLGPLRTAPFLEAEPSTGTSAFQPETPKGPHDSHFGLPLRNTVHRNMDLSTSEVQGTLNQILLQVTRLSETVGLLVELQKKGTIATNVVNEKVDFLTRKLHTSQVSSGPVNQIDVPTLPEGLQLPVDSMRAIRDVSSKVMYNAGLKKRLANYLATSGGIHLGETVGGIMKALMTNQLALQFNWKGSRDKQSFADLKLSAVVCDAVRTNEPTVSANNKAVEMKIKSWLRQARDRDGGRKRRFELSMQRSLVANTSSNEPEREETQQCPVMMPNEEQSMFPLGPTSYFHAHPTTITSGTMPMGAYAHNQQSDAQNNYS